MGSQKSPKWKFVLAYIIPLIGLIFYFAEKESTETEKENYAQAATLFIVNLIISVGANILNGIPFVGIAIWVLQIVITVFAIIAAYKSDADNVYNIPILYDFSKKLFK